MILGIVVRRGNGKLVTFTVHEPPRPPADRLDRAEEIVFLKDGFSWGAFLFAPLWLAMRQLWLALIGYVAFLAVVLGALAWFDAPSGWDFWVVFATHLVIGYEAESLRRLSLDREGWTTLGTVSGHSLDECERRFFETWLPAQPLIAFPLSAVAAAAGPATKPALDQPRPREVSRGWGGLLRWKAR
jgi:hypothetical protein